MVTVIVCDKKTIYTQFFSQPFFQNVFNIKNVVKVPYMYEVEKIANTPSILDYDRIFI